MAVILIRHKQALFGCLTHDQSGIVIRVLIVRDQKAAGAEILRLHDLVACIISIAASASVCAFHLCQPVQWVIAVEGFSSVTVHDLRDVVVFIVNILYRTIIRIDDLLQIVRLIIDVLHGFSGAVCCRALLSNTLLLSVRIILSL